jgi:hypothetical protein
MRYLLPVLSITLASCSSAKMMKNFYGDTYKYKYELIKPIVDTSLIFEDSTTKFTFTISAKEIDFVAKNKTEQPIKIIWDEASLVIYGSAEKVMHNGTKYIDRNNSQPPTTIPGNAHIDDLVVPTSKVYYREGYYSTTYSNAGGWETNDLFPTQDLKSEETKSLINASKGQEFTLYLPVRDPNGKEIGYSFVFKIRDVSCITCSNK